VSGLDTLEFSQVFDRSGGLHNPSRSLGYRENSCDPVSMRGNNDFFARLDQTEIVAELFFEDGHIGY
jgi:hypothetical protein